MIRIKLILALSFIVCLSSMGQNQKKHELTVIAGGGLSSLKIETDLGKDKKKTGGVFGIGYTYFITENIGLSSGVELAFYNSNFKLNNLNGNLPANDGVDDFEFRYSVYNHKEKQKNTFVNIPLMVQYQTRGSHRFYIAGGVKIGIPVSSDYKAVDSHIRTSAYYRQYGEETILEDPAFYGGLGTFRTGEINNDFKLKLAFMATLETGMKWELSSKIFLYTGIYADYGLNNVKKTSSDYFLKYNNESPSEYVYGSVLNSVYTKDGNSVSLVDKIVPLALGIKVKLALPI